MSDDLDNSLDEDLFKNKKDETLPVLVIVLSILTFVGCIFTVYAYFFYAIILRDTTINFDRFYLLLSVCCIVPCLVGAILMLLKKKLGFLLYVIGEGAPVLWTLYKQITNDTSFFLMNIFAMVIFYFIPIAFIYMYSINYKYFR